MLAHYQLFCLALPDLKIQSIAQSLERSDAHFTFADNTLEVMVWITIVPVAVMRLC